ncbi:MAG: hypothetical protein ABFR89_02365 [Actinomycetota bacterium]
MEHSVEELDVVECGHGKVTILATPTWDHVPDGVKVEKGTGPLSGTWIFLIPDIFIAEQRQNDSYDVMMKAMKELAALLIHQPEMLD